MHRTRQRWWAVMAGGEAQREFLKFTLIGSFLAVVPAFRAVGTLYLRGGKRGVSWTKWMASMTSHVQSAGLCNHAHRSSFHQMSGQMFGLALPAFLCDTTQRSNSANTGPVPATVFLLSCCDGGWQCSKWSSAAGWTSPRRGGRTLCF